MGKFPKVGDQAPDFELFGTDGTFCLADYRGQQVVLLFYPGDETPVCTKQFCSYRDSREEMVGLSATVVGISPQSLDSHERFIQKHGLTVPLLADTDKAVARAYGVTFPLIGVRRAMVVVDEAGIIRARKVQATGLGFQSAGEIAAVLDGLARSA
ncbi:MAG: peroxiredoxin [Actinomycetota bacterium]